MQKPDAEEFSVFVRTVTRYMARCRGRTLLLDILPSCANNRCMIICAVTSAGSTQFIIGMELITSSERESWTKCLVKRFAAPRKTFARIQMYAMVHLYQEGDVYRYGYAEHNYIPATCDRTRISERAAREIDTPDIDRFYNGHDVLLDKMGQPMLKAAPRDQYAKLVDTAKSFVITAAERFII